MGEVYVPTRVKRGSRAILLVASEAKQRSKRSERLVSLFPKGGADKEVEHLPWDANGENSGTARVELYGNGEKKYGFYLGHLISGSQKGLTPAESIRMDGGRRRCSRD